MSKILQVHGKIVPHTTKDVDTDRIIPARFMKTVTFTGLGQHVFEDERQEMNGQHPFDQPHYQGASILLAGDNFGCGSSREHAPQALMDWGIKAIIAPSFAGIFAGNCRSNGVPCVLISQEELEKVKTVLEPQDHCSIDLLQKVLIVQKAGESKIFPISMPAADWDMLVTGKWDSLGTLLEANEAVDDTIKNIPYLL